MDNSYTGLYYVSGNATTVKILIPVDYVALDSSNNLISPKDIFTVSAVTPASDYLDNYIFKWKLQYIYTDNSTEDIVLTDEGPSINIDPQIFIPTTIDGTVVGIKAIIFRVELYASRSDKENNRNYIAVDEQTLIRIIEVKPLVFNTLPTIQILEGDTADDRRIDVNNNEMTTVRIALKDINIKTGTIAYLSISYMKYQEFTTETPEEIETIRLEKLILLADLKVDIKPDVLVYAFRQELPLYDKPSCYDFRFKFIGADLNYGKDKDNTEVVIDKYNISFDGIEDFEEYYGVYNARLINGTEGGKTESSFVKIKWLDFRLQDKNYFAPSGVLVVSGFDGSTKLLTYEQVQFITGYVVYMYTADTDEQPINLYPGTGELWYYVDEFASNIAEIRCPASKWVGLWVGFKIRTPKESKISKNFLVY